MKPIINKARFLFSFFAIITAILVFLVLVRSTNAYQSIQRKYIMPLNLNSLTTSILISSGIAVLTSLIFKKIKHVPLKYMFFLIIANLIAMISVFFIFPKINAPSILVDLFYLSVIIVVIVFIESYIIYFLSKKDISLNNLFLFVGVFNAVNLILGSLILTI